MPPFMLKLCVLFMPYLGFSTGDLVFSKTWYVQYGLLVCGVALLFATWSGSNRLTISTNFTWDFCDVTAGMSVREMLTSFEVRAECFSIVCAWWRS